MNYLKNNIYKYDFYVRILFIVMSLLCMNPIIYIYVGSFYKILTIFLVIMEISSIVLYRKELLKDKKIIYIISMVIFANILSALINRQNHLKGNLVEVIFMFSYCFIFVLYNPKSIQKTFKYVIYVNQIFAFIISIIGLALWLFRIVLVFEFHEKSYFFGYQGGRLWGVINPNGSAILAYCAIGLAMLLLYRGSKYKNLLKANIVLQFIYFSIQQSRGSILSVVFMIFIYSMFIFKNAYLKRFVKFLVLSFSFLVGIYFINFIANTYTNSMSLSVISNSEISEEDLELYSSANAEFRIDEEGSSGRFNIWSQALKMGIEKPLFGYGNRNLRDYFEIYFDEYVIKNSVSGGGFHNIFITVFVSSGIFGLFMFMLLTAYISYKYLNYLLYGMDKYIKMVILLTLGILSGQLFESQIMYSTNYINIIFWTLLGYSIYLINQEKNFKYIEIKDLEEIQNIEMGILDYIHQVCEKIGVKYFLSYGTLLGAVRHKGFIPWDDDMDICLLRDDYEKLQNYLLENPDEKYELMSYKNNLNYVYSFMKIKDKNTVLEEHAVRINSNMGVYIDIFPIDAYEENQIFKDKMTKLIKKNQLSSYTFDGVKNKNLGIKNIIRYIFVVLFFIKDPTKYAKEIDELSKSRSLGDYQKADFLVYKNMNKNTVDKTLFEDLMLVDFEDRKYYIPKAYDEILKADYGDYMQLPPKEKRVSHHDFNAWKIEKVVR